MPRQTLSTGDRFNQIYGAWPEWKVSAPGRVNLIGEHIDYCDGFVLPMAIDRRVTMEARVASRDSIIITSDGMPAAHIELGSGVVKPGEPGWSNYVRGVLAGFQRRGAVIPGMDIYLSSTVPIGGGLSSSAALEVATASLLEAVSGLKLDPRDKALLCQRAEHEFAGVPCGIMDQFASVFGRTGYVLLIDCRSQAVEEISLASSDVLILIVDTRVKHELAGNEYAARRAECEEARKRLGVASFRDLVGTNWSKRVEGLPESFRRRARHVVSEIERVPAFVNCLRSQAWKDAGTLMKASHGSLRLDFEVSCPELDFVVDTASCLPGVWGCRMTGGGFGGCCVALVASAAVAPIQEAMHDAYLCRFNLEPAFYVSEPADGPRVEKL